jgi:hypothetical protein
VTDRLLNAAAVAAAALLVASAMNLVAVVTR